MAHTPSHRVPAFQSAFLRSARRSLSTNALHEQAYEYYVKTIKPQYPRVDPRAVIPWPGKTLYKFRVGDSYHAFCTFTHDVAYKNWDSGGMIKRWQLVEEKIEEFKKSGKIITIEELESANCSSWWMPQESIHINPNDVYERPRPSEYGPPIYQKCQFFPSDLSPGTIVQYEAVEKDI